MEPSDTREPRDVGWRPGPRHPRSFKVGMRVRDRQGRVREIVDIDYSAYTKEPDGIRWKPVSGFGPKSRGGLIFAWNLAYQVVEVLDE